MSRSKYTKAERDVAALICAIAASQSDRSDAFYDRIADDIGADDASLFLAQDAWTDSVERRPGGADFWDWLPERDAEAESMIRTGWEPS